MYWVISSQDPKSIDMDKVQRLVHSTYTQVSGNGEHLLSFSLLSYVTKNLNRKEKMFCRVCSINIAKTKDEDIV